MDISITSFNNSQDGCFDMKQKIQPIDPSHNLIGGRYKMQPVTFEDRVIVSYADFNFRSEFFDFIYASPSVQCEIIRRPAVNLLVNPQHEAVNWLNIYYFLTSVEGLRVMANGAVHLACSMSASGEYRIIYMRWGGQGLVLRSYPLEDYNKLVTKHRYWLSTERQELPVSASNSINKYYFA